MQCVGEKTCKRWVPLADLRQTVCKCGSRFPKDVLLAASLAGAEVEGFTAADEADAEGAAAFRKRAERKAELKAGGKKEFRDKPWFRKNPEVPAAPSSQVEQSQNFFEYLAAGNLSLTKDMLQHIMSTAKAKGMLNFATMPWSGRTPQRQAAIPPMMLTWKT